MNRTNLSELTADQLVDRFAEIAIAQDRAERDGNNALYNRLYKRMDAVDYELRARGSDARAALLNLYDHPNMQVRLKAATRTLAVAPAKARAALQAIRDSQWFPQAMDAGMLISGLDDGSFKPT